MMGLYFLSCVIFEGDIWLNIDIKCMKNYSYFHENGKKEMLDSAVEKISLNSMRLHLGYEISDDFILKIMT